MNHLEHAQVYIDLPKEMQDDDATSFARAVVTLYSLLDKYKARLALVEPLVTAAKLVRRGNYSVRSRLEYADRRAFDEFNQVVDVLLVAEEAATKDPTP